MATLGLKEMGKFLREGREKELLEQGSSTLNSFSCIFQKNSAMATLGLFGKCKKKSGIMKSGLDAMPLFLLSDLLSHNF